jgi:hypothetical protein
LTLNSNDVKACAASVLVLLLDHQRLGLQRKYAAMDKDNLIPHITGAAASSLIIGERGDRGRKISRIPDFSKLHADLRPSQVPSIAESLMCLTTPTMASEDNDEDEDGPVGSRDYFSSSSAGGGGGSRGWGSRGHAAPGCPAGGPSYPRPSADLINTEAFFKNRNQ